MLPSEPQLAVERQPPTPRRCPECVRKHLSLRQCIAAGHRQVPPGFTARGHRQARQQQPSAATKFKLSTKGFTGLKEITSWRPKELKGVVAAEVLATYDSQVAPVWRSLFSVLREGGYRVVRHFIETAAPQHQHLFRVGHRKFGDRVTPVIVTDFDKNDPGLPYRVVHSDCDCEDITQEELAAAEELAIGSASLNLLVSPKIRRKPRILDLCCGTKSISKALKKLFPGAKIITVDIDPAFLPTILADVREWKVANDFRKGHFDMIWASPPCTEYSLAKTTGTRDLQTADSIVTAVLRIIDYLQPRAWFLENPHALLGTRPFMQKLECFKNTCTYCRYGFPYRKETDIWTNVNVGELRHCADHNCPMKQIYGHHLQTAQAGPTRSGVPGTPRDFAYRVPAPLLRQLVRAAALKF